MTEKPSSIIMVWSASAKNETPICFSKNSPPFNYNHTVASTYYSAVFTGLGLSSNLFAFVVLVKAFHRSQSPSHTSFLIFLSSLVVTDFMGLLVTGSIVLSFRTTHFDWHDLDPQCHFCNFMGVSMVFYGLCPLLLGAAMAMERFAGIHRPFALSANMSKSRALSTVLAVWVFAGCVGLLPLTGLGSYHLQQPGSWCFFNISSQPLDMTFCLVFCLVGLLSLAASFLLNTVSVVTLLRICCGQGDMQRQRNLELEMMGQLVLIMIIASICWCPLLVSIAQTVLSGKHLQIVDLLLWIRFATCNQILDPWVYILFRCSIFKCIFPVGKERPRGSMRSLYPTSMASRRRRAQDSAVEAVRGEGAPCLADQPTPQTC
ncbi:thromboxane A2 receptor-like [Conger conger]|uniref:thromboxane A2 receptor-like n=1 Tax=Conger conger TaxID=82655 RepID=UPI002A59C4B5|nr:thromboxane A2 receptor-like [Conger conger]